MLFDGSKASGYFSGDCIEGDVAGHAAQVLADGVPRHLHYGTGSPWIDIRLRCGGALHVWLERLPPGCQAVKDLLRFARERQPCMWRSDGIERRVTQGTGPLVAVTDEPFLLQRRYDPPRRLIVSGGDPGALAAARLGTLAQFETILLRPDGPRSPPPFPVSQYLREEPSEALQHLGVDRWTAYLGATHEDHLDLGGCLAALRGGAGYVGMIGAKSRAPGRFEALRAAGATQDDLDALRRDAIRRARTNDPASGQKPAITPDFSEIIAALQELGAAGAAADKAADAVSASGDAGRAKALNDTLIQVERAFLNTEGLPKRPWFRHMLIAPGLTTGYAAWPFPALQEAIENKDAEMFANEAKRVVSAIRAAAQRLNAVQTP